jgi:hypothetical protein
MATAIPVITQQSTRMPPAIPTNIQSLRLLCGRCGGVCAA